MHLIDRRPHDPHPRKHFEILRAAATEPSHKVRNGCDVSRHVDPLTGRARLFFELYARELRQLRVEAVQTCPDVFRITGNLRRTLYGSALINVSTVGPKTPGNSFRSSASSNQP